MQIEKVLNEVMVRSGWGPGLAEEEVIRYLLIASNSKICHRHVARPTNKVSIIND